MMYLLTLKCCLIIQLILALPSSFNGNSHKCKVTELDKISKKQCNDSGYAIRCIGAHLKDVPRNYTGLHPHNRGPFCLLDLNKNSIKTLKKDVFKNANVTHIKVLFLAENIISHIDSSAFDGLSNLLYLNLSKNQLTWPASFGHNVFKPLTNLITLNMKANNFTHFHGLDKDMSDLKGLRKFFINACPVCVFGEGFKELSNLTELSLSGVSGNDCNMSKVNINTFTYMPSLKYLYMCSCNIKYIDAGAFSPLVNIVLLDISYNTELNFTGMNIALYGLRNSSTLNKLYVNQLHGLYEMGTELKVEHLQNLKTLRNLQVLKMDLNKIEVFEKEIFTSYQLPMSLTFVTLSGNRINYGEYVRYIHVLKKVYFLDISRQHMLFDPFRKQHYPEMMGYSPEMGYSPKSRYQTESENVFNNKHTEFSNPVNQIAKGDVALYKSIPQRFNDMAPCRCNDNKTYCQRIFLPDNLRRLLWRESYIYSIVPPMLICGPKNLYHIDLSFNAIHAWKGPVYGVSKVSYLDMSMNNCQYMKWEFFHTFYSLHFLNISSNSLGYHSFTDEVFQNMSRLHYLDLSYNKIRNLPSKIFSSLKSLRKLHLVGNMLGEWKPELKNCKYLELLNVSSNKLETLPESLMTDIDLLTGTSCSNRSITRVLAINLSHNPIKCTCNNLKFLKWVNRSRVEFHKHDYCTLLDGSKHYLKDISTIVLKLEQQCTDYEWLIITCVVILSCIITTAVCVLSYKNRWKLRYIYHSRNRRFIHKGYERLFEFDAFVSYISDDASFIKHKVVPELENRYGLKLWVADRNSLPGSSIAQNISHAIYSSRKTIILLNRRYCHDSWCDYEFNMAHTESIETKRKLMIIVFMEDVPPQSIPIGILRLLRNEISMEYPQNPQHVDMFWSDLAEKVMN